MSLEQAKTWVRGEPESDTVERWHRETPGDEKVTTRRD